MADGVAEEPRGTGVSLIEAKLARPRIRAGVIARPRLFRALDRLDHVELTVISGPADSGKSVLVSSWLADRTDRSVAWVTLDRGDDDPVRLWTYVAHAVAAIRPGLAGPALARLRMPRAKVETGIDELLNGLARYDGRVVIVLDDLQHVSSERCLRSLAYAAVERLPGGPGMVAMTRSDPGRRLGRLRARGALRELRAHEIAFNHEEACELLVARVGHCVEHGGRRASRRADGGLARGGQPRGALARRCRRAERGHPAVLRRPPSRRRLSDVRGAGRYRGRDAELPAQNVDSGPFYREAV